MNNVSSGAFYVSRVSHVNLGNGKDVSIAQLAGMVKDIRETPGDRSVAIPVNRQGRIESFWMSPG